MLDATFFENVRAFSGRVQKLKDSLQPADDYVLAELETAAAELRAAEDELRQQSLNLLAAHEQLDAERARYRDLFEAAPDGYLVTDRTGKIYEANRAAANMLGLNAEFLTGRPFLRFFVEHDQEVARREILQLHQSHRPSEWTARIAPRGGASSFWATLRVSATTDIDGKLTSIRWLVRDVSQFKEMEARLRQINDQLEERVASRTRELERANRQKEESLARAQDAKHELERHGAGKDQFMAMLSHELRTPLAPALAILTDLARRTDLPGDVQQQVAAVVRNIQLEVRLVDDLLDATRATRGKLALRKERIDVHELIAAVAQICRADFDGDKQIRLAVEANAPRHHVDGDSARLHQVLWNLLRNAAKFSLPGGEVTLRTLHAGDEIEIHIIDQGIGIEPSRLATIFQPFEQGDDSITHRFGGLGLGLAIVKSVTEAHGGHVWAESRGLGRGASFIIRLPLASAPTLRKPKPAAPSKFPAVTSPAPHSVRPLRVLLVDDHAETRSVFARLLKGMGHEVTAAGTVQDALFHARNSSFDILLSDIQLPDGTGYDIVQQCGTNRPRRAIAVSGFGGPDEIARSKASGFDQHLTKPVSFTDLEALFRETAAS
jgi:PAS domain S-box-containing protein